MAMQNPGVARTFAQPFVASVLALADAVASLEVVNAGPVGDARVLRPLAHAAVALVDAVGAVNLPIAAVLAGLTLAVIAAKRTAYEYRNFVLLLSVRGIARL